MKRIATWLLKRYREALVGVGALLCLMFIAHQLYGPVFSRVTSLSSMKVDHIFVGSVCAYALGYTLWKASANGGTSS